MNRRRPVQVKHERYLVDEFIRWWELHTGEHFKVILRPIRPDAIVRSDQRTTWLEVTDTFFSDTWAQDLYSYATLGEKHKSMEPGPYIGMDEQTAVRFASLLKKKLSKKSYAKTHSKYGSGILIVGMQSPWFNGETCKMMNKACSQTDWSTDKGYFSSVFISFSSLNQQTFEKWEWKEKSKVVD